MLFVFYSLEMSALCELIGDDGVPEVGLTFDDILDYYPELRDARDEENQ